MKQNIITVTVEFLLQAITSTHKSASLYKQFYLGELVGLPSVGEARRGGKGGGGATGVVPRRRSCGDARGDIMGLRPP